MASGFSQLFLPFLLLLGFLCRLPLLRAQDVNIHKETVKQWAEEFGNLIYDLSQTYSGSDELQKAYNDVSDKITALEVNGTELVLQTAANMEIMLEKKVEAVEGLVRIAEESNVEHDYLPDIEANYYNARCINMGLNGADFEDSSCDATLGGIFQLETNEHFNNIAVNLTESTVQVPTNVYNKSPGILNNITFTEKLDEVFYKNYLNDPTLTWQYFGSYTGYFRNYPGIKWEVDSETNLDLYDCRERGWYIQAATSPKDMLILLDASGSMSGLRMEIAKHTVNTIIDTLRDDDFFNVMAFNNIVNYVEPCFNKTMVQANSDNKELIKSGLDNVKADYIAEFDVALTEAFDLLEKFNQTGQGSDCNQAIMLITDGSQEKYSSLFDKYNSNNLVRMFTYVIGQEVTYSANVMWMACTNKGYFTQIRTIADVQENVSKYLHVLSRPMVINQIHDTVWTEVYLDIAGNEGLSLMTTVAQPVFNKKNDTFNKGVLLGVVGTDVPVFELLKITPQYKVGVNGYSFAITNNGYILFHPDLRPTYEEEGQEDPIEKPNYNSVDLAEVELADSEEMFLQLRTAMVDRETGNITMSVKMHTSGMKRVSIRENNYFFTPLKNTPFSFGMVLPSGYGFYGVNGSVEESEGLEKLTGFNISLAQKKKYSGTWVYCSLTNEEAKEMTQLESIKTFLNDNKWASNFSEKCDEELVNLVLLDATMTFFLESYWKEKFYEQITDDDVSLFNDTSTFEAARNGIVLAFVGTEAGLTRTYQNPNISNVFSDFLDENTNTIEEDYYYRAVELGSDRFLFSVPFDAGLHYNDTNETSFVTASTPIMVNGKAVAAVAGIQIKLTEFRRKFIEITSKNLTDCNSDTYACTCESEFLDCYVLDNNAYIVISEQPENIGQHFAIVESSIVEHLNSTDNLENLNTTDIYQEIKITDYQGMCPKETSNLSCAPKLLNPFFSLMTYILKWSKAIGMFVLHLSLYNWWHVFDNYAEGVLVQDDISYEPCDQETTFYLSNPKKFVKGVGGSISVCEDTTSCEKSFHFEPIPKTNLILVVVDADCDCEQTNTALDLGPSKKEYNATSWCQRLKTQRHRKRPESCFSNHPDEDSSDCGRGHWFKPSTLLFTASLLFTRVLVELL